MRTSTTTDWAGPCSASCSQDLLTRSLPTVCVSNVILSVNEWIVWPRDWSRFLQQTWTANLVLHSGHSGPTKHFWCWQQSSWNGSNAGSIKRWAIIKLFICHKHHPHTPVVEIGFTRGAIIDLFGVIILSWWFLGTLPPYLRFMCA